MEPLSRGLQHQPQDSSSIDSYVSKRSSTATASTVSTSSSSTSKTAAASPPPSSLAASSFTRRRQRLKTQQHQQVEYAVLQGHQNQDHRRPPSMTTERANSEITVCYSSSDGEDEEHYQALSARADTENKEAEAPRNEPDTLEGNRLVQQAPQQQSISSSQNFDDSVSISSIDVEMGGVHSEVGPSPRLHQNPSAPWRQPQQQFLGTGLVVSPQLSSGFRSRRRRSSPSSQWQPQPSLSTTTNHVNDNDDQPTNQSPSLRASLDAGMAAVRSWVKSRGSTNNNRLQPPPPPFPEPVSQQLRPRSRSVTWQPSPSTIGSNSVASASSQAGSASVSEEELDDLLQLDDLSTFTNNSSTTIDDDSFVSGSSGSNPRYRPASAPTIPAPYRHQPRHHRRQTHKPNTWSLQNNFQSQPDTILEELDEGGDNDYSRSRQRSQSEPDSRRVTDFFLGPVPSTRYDNSNTTHTGNRGTPRRRRPLGPGRNNSENQGAEHEHHQAEATTSSSTAFSRRMKNLPLSLPRIDSEGASLSSSAAAALSNSPSPAALESPTLMHEFSDAGASVATTATVAAESTIELTVTPSNHSNLPGSSSISPLSPTTTVHDTGTTFQGTNGNIAARTPPRNIATQQPSSPTRPDPAGGVSTSSSNNGGNPQPQPPMAREGSARSDTTRQSQVTEAERQARIRWIRINRRFQFVITVVALLFSLLLFAILICWVVLTSAYVLSFDKSCDVHLKRYYWLVTLQLVLDVFRSDIMRFVFRWDANSNQRIPVRVVVYNVTYLVYALLVLRLGVRSVFIQESTCRKTAPELYNSSTAFVSLSLAAWATIVCGYLLPFCVVAAMLTCNGYSPTSHISADERDGATPVFPAAYATTGAPPGTIDRLTMIRLENVRESSRECCICMEEFTSQDVLIETECKHVFHKQCCREWLRQARTCPVCRSDIPGSLEAAGHDEPDSSSRIPIGPTGRPVVGLFRILRRTTGEIVRTMSTSSPSHAVPSNTSGSRSGSG